MFGNPSNPRGDAATLLKQHGWTNGNWLKSRFHFHFAEYHDSSNRNDRYGVLRVMNDDLVQPATGFGRHPHRDMEIVTYVVEGELTHQDSGTGGSGMPETLGRGAVQYMSAGTGVMHSEHNRNLKSPCRFIQMWIVPRSRGLKPQYGGKEFSAPLRANRWCHMVGDAAASAAAVGFFAGLPDADGAVAADCGAPAVVVQQDVNILSAEVAAGKSLTLPVRPGRQAYLLVTETGTPLLSSEGARAQAIAAGTAFDDKALTSVAVAYAGAAAVKFDVHDAAEVRGPDLADKAEAVPLTVTGPGHFLVVEMAKDSSGRADLP